MDPKKRQKKDILYISISSFILTVAWVGFSIYHNWVTTTISETLQVQIQPIDPSFDQDTLQRLKNRQPIAPVYESKVIPTTPAETAPAASQKPEITPTTIPDDATDEESGTNQPLTPAPSQAVIQGL